MFFFGIAFTQNNKANVYELGKGEVLKKDYYFLSYLYDGMYQAILNVEGVEDNLFSEYAGVIDQNENVIIPFTYRNVHAVSSSNFDTKEKQWVQLYKNKKGSGLYRLTKDTFENYCPHEYIEYQQNSFNTNIFIVSGFNTQHLFDVRRRKLIKTDAEKIVPLNTELYAVMDRKKRNYGVVNAQYDTVLRHKFHYISPSINSFFIVENERNNQKGAIDSLGRMLLPPVFTHVIPLNNLLVTSTTWNSKQNMLEPIDKDEIRKMTVKYPVKNKVLNIAKKRNLKDNRFFGAFNRKGKLIIPFEYNSLSSVIGTDIVGVKRQQYHLFNEQGERIKTFDWSAMSIAFNKYYIASAIITKGVYSSFKSSDSDGYTKTYTSSSIKTKGVYSSNGQELLSIEYDDIVALSENKFILLKEGVWYTWDTKSEPVETCLPSNYEIRAISLYPRELTQNTYFELKSNGKYGVIDINLNVIIAPTHSVSPTLCKGGYFSFDKTYYTLNGVSLATLDPSGVIYTDDTVFSTNIVAKKEGQYGVVNQYGYTIIPFVYKSIVYIDDNRFIVNR
jgi:hypothetical protein